MKKIRIMIACHKKAEVPADSLYLPVQVGASGKEDIGFQRDDEGENISAKNDIYCELTGLYWCWKNLDTDYLGLVHYRRYFTMRRHRDGQNALAAVLNGKQAQELMGRYDVILPRKRKYYISTVYDHYSSTFSQEQLDETRSVLQKGWPDYVAYWDQVMKARSAYVYNMFIMPMHLVDSYCTWVFSVLAELEKRISTDGMTAFEKRYAGRVSERLFNAWLLHEIAEGHIRRDRVHEIPYVYIGRIDWFRKISGFLQAKFFGKKYEKSF